MEFIDVIIGLKRFLFLLLGNLSNHWSISPKTPLLVKFPFALVWQCLIIGPMTAIPNVTGNECGNLAYIYNTCTDYTDYNTYKEK